MRACLAIALLSVATGFAHAQPSQKASVWFRSAAGCPDGSAFVQALAARDVAARLAQVGDAIDFVVTLGKAADGRSGGVLERQTQTGTVAIRRVDDPSCDQVAEALALTLALAVQGERAQGDDAGSPVAATPAAPDAAVAPADVTATAQTSAAPMPAAAQSSPGSAALRDDDAVANIRAARVQQPTRWSLGLQAFAVTGLLPDFLPGGSAFVEIGWGGGSNLWRPALRIGLLAAFGSSTEADRDIRMRVFSGRVAGCPIALGAGALVARPCLALELGQIQGEVAAAAGGSTGGLWAAVEAAARLSLRASSALSFEVELGLLVPWTRYSLQLTSDSAVVDRMAALGAAARVGAVLHFL